MKNNQFTLLKKQRFLYLFLTQFLGAFNDNLYKNAFIILVTFQLAMQDHLSVSTLVNSAAAAFILPFFLFSATFGQLADKLEKSRLIRLTKYLELIIVIIAVFAFNTNSVSLLLVVLFLLGTQSTLFGPLKYSILPQHLKKHELVGGNALIESGTFVAIIIGSAFGGFLISMQPDGKVYVSTMMVIIAVAGLISSYFIPKASAASPHIQVNWNIFTETFRNIKQAQKNRTVFLSILGISWFWFYGSLFFYQVANYTKTVLHSNEHVVTFLIIVFAVGIGVGSLLCEVLSKRKIEIGLVPLGAIGISIFSLLLYFVQPTSVPVAHTFMQFLGLGHSWVVIICLFLLAAFGGLYNVPLYALVQDRSNPKERSRMIATNNIMNALFMVFAAIFAIVLLRFGLTIPHLFLVAAILNVGVAAFIFFEVPEFFMRFLVWILASFCYDIKVKGADNIPYKGPVIIASNHISFVDPVIITAAAKRPIHFLMDHRQFNTPILESISKLAKAIPVATSKENPKLKDRALYRSIEALLAGCVLGIYPEGSITRDGKLGEFKRGIEQLVEQSHATVVPVAVQGLWGSFFSRKYGKAMSHFPKSWRRSTVGVNIGKPIRYYNFNLDELREAVQALLDDKLDPSIADEVK